MLTIVGYKPEYYLLVVLYGSASYKCDNGVLMHLFFDSIYQTASKYNI
jgi:hypothetical protein